MQAVFMYNTRNSFHSNTMKRIALFVCLAALPVVILSSLYPEKVFEQTEMTEMYHSVHGADVVAFVRDGCPHCAAFEEYALEHSIDVQYYEISQIDSQKFFSDLQQRAPALNQGVPTIVINGSVSQGYDDDEHGEAIVARLQRCQSSSDGCLPLQDFLNSDATVEVMASGESCDENCDADLDKYTLDLWFIGKLILH